MSGGDRPDRGEPRPTVVVSECLGFTAVRYNGQILKSRFVEALRDHVEFRPICPEVEIGLGVPRDPIRIVVDKAEAGAGAAADESGADQAPESATADSGTPEAATGTPGSSRKLALVQPSTGRDLTGAMDDFASGFLGGLDGVDGFILKSKSPSCGISDAKVMAGPEEGAPSVERGPGMFARHVLESYPWAAIQDEGRLTNLKLRHHFLTHLYAAARLRAAEESGRMKELVRFQTEHKLLFMAYDQDGMRELGRIVANPDGLPFHEVVAAYREGMGRVLSKPPKEGNTVNALQHAFGYVSEDLDAGEKEYFGRLLGEFRSGRLPLPGMLAVLRSWVVRFGQEYLDAQRLFEPYPPALFDLSSSGDGRLV